MNPVVHFEMPYDDRARMARFYETAFGWKTQSLGEEMGNYVTAATTEDRPRRQQPLAAEARSTEAFTPARQNGRRRCRRW